MCWGDVSGRKRYWFLLLCLSALTGLLFLLGGAKAWELWNIPVIQPNFNDLRILTAGAESHALGSNPDLANPRHPYGRPFNLPKIWHLLFYAGIDQGDTAWLAGTLILSFFIGLWIFPGRLDRPGAWLLALSVFSPPVMLAFERGNVDLFIFFLSAISLVFLTRSGWLATVVLALSALLKIFPLFGTVALLRLEKERFVRRAALILGVFAVYAALTFDNFRLIFANTEKGFQFSYGAGVLGLYALDASGLRWMYAMVTLFSYLLVIGLLLLALCQVDRRGQALPASEPRHLDAFRLGAGIYLGTFLLGSNWDYRLMFLLFVLPQLLSWARSNGLARVTLGGILLSMGSLWIAALIGRVAFFLDEAANWLAFAGLLYLLLASAPGWIKGEINAFFLRHGGAGQSPGW